MARIHDTILQLRKEQGLTQRQIAEKLGLSESTYNRIENGEIDLAYQRHLVPLARVYDMKVEDLFVYRHPSYVRKDTFQEIKDTFEKLRSYF